MRVYLNFISKLAQCNLHCGHFSTYAHTQTHIHMGNSIRFIPLCAYAYLNNESKRKRRRKRKKRLVGWLAGWLVGHPNPIEWLTIIQRRRKNRKLVPAVQFILDIVRSFALHTDTHTHTTHTQIQSHINKMLLRTHINISFLTWMFTLHSFGPSSYIYYISDLLHRSFFPRLLLLMLMLMLVV